MYSLRNSHELVFRQKKVTDEMLDKTRIANESASMGSQQTSHPNRGGLRGHRAITGKSFFRNQFILDKSH
jgi:hypothetical protein